MVLPDNTYARVTHFFLGDGAPSGAATGYVVRADGGAVINMDDVTAIHDAFGSEIMDSLSDTVSLVQTLLKRGPDEDGPTATADNVWPGLQAGTGVPANTSILITKNTASGGHRGKGRNYIPGLPEAQVDSAGTLIGATQANIQAQVDAWLVELAAAGLGYGVYLEHHGDGAPNPTLVTAMNVEELVATQRRRLRR